MVRTKRNCTNCCVFSCNSAHYNSPGASFHEFPKVNSHNVVIENKFGVKEKIDANKAWHHILKMGKTASVHMKVCSKHFTESDFFNHGGPVQRRRLKKGVVPSVNLPVASHDPKSPRKTRKAQLASQRILRKARRHMHTCSVPIEEIAEQNPTPDDLVAANALLNLFAPVEETSSEHAAQTPMEGGLEDKGVQVTSGNIYVPFSWKLKTEAKLNSLTGLPTFRILDFIVDLVKTIVVDKRIHRLTLKDRVILTFMKLKLNISYAVLSILFGNLTPTSCRSEFKKMVVALSVVLKPAIPWPSREEISRNLPKCFRNFPLARVVLDCTEVAIQKPKCLPCRLKLYSHYKGTLTLKWMTGISPGGLITFLSKAYGGRASDSTIFLQSGILDILEKNDCIMVDKGFLVDVPCFDKGIDIIRPTFLRGKVKFSKEEALDNRDISRARVHVERANARIKSMNFFSQKFEWSQLSIADNAFTVVCGLVNLTSPLLADDKF